jgi:hypothetical protein
MKEAGSLKTVTETTLSDIAKHTRVLAAGLQNAAPPQEGGPGKSVRYLAEITTQLEELTQSIDGLLSSSIPSQKN